MSGDADLETQKAEARQMMRAERARCANPEAALKLMEAFPLELAQLTPVAGYWPVGGEIDPRPLLAALAKAGRAVALPRMETRAGPARFYAWRAGDALTADAFGVPSPPVSEEIKPRLILTPLLAFDRAGHRLGQGGGHYDRILGAYRAAGAIAVGLAYAEQEMERVPVGPLDAPLDWVVTEREAIRCAPVEGLRGRE
ncbi:MAG TPA: 5-formyltetrahydrofolate cyclo-ligase [Caulobacterales bacterium]|nr:5-formyltetrahydrofolate cyclo-ligase [Caulobacterales bacterium]